MSQVEEFKTGLMKLQPSDDEFPVQVDELLESIPKELHESLIPSIFQFFEAHPLEECGMPGGLVHLVENYYPNYKQILIRSMQKAPNFSSILMVNRILNSELSEDERNEYTALLIELSNNSGADEALRINAKDFIKFQSEKSS
jgi:hypothetical protein